MQVTSFCLLLNLRLHHYCSYGCNNSSISGTSKLSPHPQSDSQSMALVQRLPQRLALFLHPHFHPRKSNPMHFRSRRPRANSTQASSFCGPRANRAPGNRPPAVRTTLTVKTFWEVISFPEMGRGRMFCLGHLFEKVYLSKMVNKPDFFSRGTRRAGGAPSGSDLREPAGVGNIITSWSFIPPSTACLPESSLHSPDYTGRHRAEDFIRWKEKSKKIKRQKSQNISWGREVGGGEKPFCL